MQSTAANTRGRLSLRTVPALAVAAALAMVIVGCDDMLTGDADKPTFGNHTVPDQRYVAGVPIPTVTLPQARGGNGTLSYRLLPETPPGITFSAERRTLGGIPLAIDTYSMRYEVRDADGDTAALSFRIVAQPFTTLYWWNDFRIERSTLNGRNREVAVGGGSLELPLAVSVAGGRMYWLASGTSVDPSKIRRADLDGSNVEDLLGLESAYAMTIDVGAGKIYWTESKAAQSPELGQGSAGIRRANLDGTGVEDVLTFSSSTRLSSKRIAVDGAGRKIYWTDPTTERGRIRRANLDGTGVETILAGIMAGERPAFGGLDVADGKIYWSQLDGMIGKIRRADLNGTGVEDLLTYSKGGFGGIALDAANRKLYWTEGEVRDGRLGSSKIGRANLDGTAAEDVLTASAGFSAFSLDVTEQGIYWTEISERNESTKIRRAALDGSHIQDLMSATVPRPSSNFALDAAARKMYWNNGLVIRRSNLDGSGSQDLLAVDRHPGAIALDVVNGRMYWLEGDVIRRANLDGSGPQDLLAVDRYPDAIALDVVNGRMYWLEGDVIRRANLDGSGPQDLLTVDRYPGAIALDVVNGKMYWNDGRVIRRANLDGSNPQDLLTAHRNVGVIALDVVNGKMYWRDVGGIRKANLDGTGRRDTIVTDDRGVLLSGSAFALGIR